MYIIYYRDFFVNEVKHKSFETQGELVYFINNEIQYFGYKLMDVSYQTGD
jgi:hypothetical protein